jgi:hypothetical protein
MIVEGATTFDVEFIMGKTGLQPSTFKPVNDATGIG